MAVESILQSHTYWNLYNETSLAGHIAFSNLIIPSEFQYVKGGGNDGVPFTE
jgi:hypothetical protein